jgi:heat shock protein HslJ
MAVLAAGCTTTPASNPSVTALAGSSWRVFGLNGGSVDSFRVTISFQDDRAIGYASCNDYVFGYNLDGRRLEFADAVVMTTDRVCDPDAEMVEERFLATLGDVDHAGLTESGALILYADHGRIVARPS